MLGSSGRSHGARVCVCVCVCGGGGGGRGGLLWPLVGWASCLDCASMGYKAHLVRQQREL